MAFPNAHLYLTAHWAPTGIVGETGQVGIRFDSTAPATQSLVDACATAWQTFWTAATAKIPVNYSLKFLRLASVDTNGRYVAGTIAYDHSYGAGFSGAGSLVEYPLQTSCVASLTTALVRGQAHAGRIYLPPLYSALSATQYWPSADVTARANALAAAINSLNGALPGPATIFSRGTVRSNTGAKQKVTAVKIGARPDVQRRRAKSVAEAYGTPANVL